MESIRMRKVTQAIASAKQLDKMDMTFLQDPGEAAGDKIETLKQEEQARKLFSELARMYRGAVALAVAHTSSSSHGENVKDKEKWFQELLKWSYECGNPSCYEQLKVVPAKGKKEKFRFGLSIAVKDARIGFKEERLVNCTSVLAPTHARRLTLFVGRRSP